MEGQTCILFSYYSVELLSLHPSLRKTEARFVFTFNVTRVKAFIDEGVRKNSGVVVCPVVTTWDNFVSPMLHETSAELLTSTGMSPFSRSYSPIRHSLLTVGGISFVLD